MKYTIENKSMSKQVSDYKPANYLSDFAYHVAVAMAADKVAHTIDSKRP